VPCIKEDTTIADWPVIVDMANGRLPNGLQKRPEHDRRIDVVNVDEVESTVCEESDEAASPRVEVVPEYIGG